MIIGINFWFFFIAICAAIKNIPGNSENPEVVRKEERKERRKEEGEKRKKEKKREIKIFRIDTSGTIRDRDSTVQCSISLAV
jgi:hypothetical protein